VSLLTLYRPNFCAECGDKIFRLRWRIWTNRRFCQNCSPKFRREHWVRNLLAVVAVLTLGIVAGRAIRRPAPPLVIQRNVVAATPAEQQTQPPATLADDVYICGARTKKGTPCSRRVHGPVRCWQHKGLPSMIPVLPIK